MEKEMGLKGAMKDTLNMAKSENEICYLYEDPGRGDYWASFEYWDDWLFKAYPGGRTELSVSGKSLTESEE